ncbi:ExeA family protein [Neptuniibacter sp.]|uniref:ExeA family protein n=1 Tax=Neptuniibacter sp. TaxID=1962643 RepID=UPI002627B565|nr:ExeA family protein [Neptuniibacter sp.]MCP4595120.1 AAA family ATPase [Neptuniibacter sp.]
MDNPQYLSRINLEFNPFPVTPDASHYFRSQALEINLAELMHCVEARKGFMLVTGDIGMGKTTLSRKLIAELKSDGAHVALVFNSFLRGESLLKAINTDFGIEPISDSIDEQLKALNNHLLSLFQQGGNCVILIDDAQHLDIESLELIRQISNLETNQHKLVQIILIAQPEILQTLNLEELRQLKSRIALHIGLNPFSEKTIQDYVSYRLNVAGNNGRITMTRSALKEITRLSRGYPRKVNLLMDRCLYILSSNARYQINERDVETANDDLGWDRVKSSNGAGNVAMFSFASIVLLAGALLYFEPALWPKLKNMFSPEPFSQSEKISFGEKTLNTSREGSINDATLNLASSVNKKEINNPAEVGDDAINAAPDDAGQSEDREVDLKKIEESGTLAVRENTPLTGDNRTFSAAEFSDNSGTEAITEEQKSPEQTDFADIKKAASTSKVEESTAKQTPENLSEASSVNKRDETIDAFLQVYGLENLHDVFMDAVKDNKFYTFQEALQDTPWRLVMSDRALTSDKISSAVYKSPDHPKWMFLWQPTVELGPLIYGEYSPGIKKIQQVLSQKGFYKEIIDGVVGSKTKLAIARYQKSIGLPATGEPDLLTLSQLVLPEEKYNSEWLSRNE